MQEVDSQHPHRFGMILILVGATIAVLLIVFLILALIGWYTLPVLIGSTLLVVVLGIIVTGRRRWIPSSTFGAMQKIDAFVLLSIVVFSVFITTGKHEYPQSRDDLAYLIGTTKLAETGGLVFSDIYAEPVNGVFESNTGSYTSQFLPGYSLYLALWEQLGDFRFLRHANAPLLIGTLLALYFIGVLLQGRPAGVVVVVFSLSAFVFHWFPQRFNSENLFQFLFWIAVLAFVYAQKRKIAFPYYCGALALSATILVRAEGIFYLFAYLFLVELSVRRTQSKAQFGSVPLQPFRRLYLYLIPVISATLLVFYYGVIQWQYATSQISRALRLEGNGTQLVLIVFLVLLLFIAVRLRIRASQSFRDAIFSGHWYSRIAAVFVLSFIILLPLVFVTQYDIAKDVFKPLYVLLVFHGFGILLLLAIGVAGMVRAKGSEIYVLLMAAPSFIFLLEPYLAFDLPWFLRRFFPVIIPLALLLGAVMLVRYLSVRRGVLIGAICIVSIGLFIPTSAIVGFKDHEGINAQLQTFADQFVPGRDLVLMDSSVDERRWGVALHFFYGIDSLHNPQALGKERLAELLSQHQHSYVVFSTNEPDTYASAVSCEQSVPTAFRYTELESTNRITQRVRQQDSFSRPSLRALFGATSFLPEKKKSIAFDLFPCKIIDTDTYLRETFPLVQ